MSALTAERDTTLREGRINVLPVAAGVQIFAGGIVAKNPAGFAVPASDTAGLIVMGRAEETVFNDDGANGACFIKTREGCFSYSGSGFTAASLGQPVFIVDDNDVALSGTVNEVFAGIIKQVESAEEVFVQMDPDNRCAAGVAAVASPDANAQTAAYVQADVQTIATVANETKAKLNAVIAALKAVGLMGS
jgi:hypothetical protein